MHSIPSEGVDIDQLGAVTSAVETLHEELRRMQSRLVGGVIVPVRGRVSAGGLVSTEEEAGDSITVPAEMVAGMPDAYALIVSGDSMTPDLMDGDRVLVDPGREWQPNNIVVVRVRGTETTIKRLVARDTTVILVPTNRTYPVLEVPADDVELLGVAVQRIASLV
jgi:SOS-response transcriptional repressor LexA